LIITTLAARAYSGESDLISAMDNILRKMGHLISDVKPRVPNPVNPVEDFADKWYSPEHTQYRLEDNFHRWLMQAQADFEALCGRDNVRNLVEAAKRGFKVNFEQTQVERMLGATPAVVAAPKQVDQSAAKPWLQL